MNKRLMICTITAAVVLAGCGGGDPATGKSGGENQDTNNNGDNHSNGDNNNNGGNNNNGDNNSPTPATCLAQVDASACAAAGCKVEICGEFFFGCVKTAPRDCGALPKLSQLSVDSPLNGWETQARFWDQALVAAGAQEPGIENRVTVAFQNAGDAATPGLKLPVDWRPLGGASWVRLGEVDLPKLSPGESHTAVLPWRPSDPGLLLLRVGQETRLFGNIRPPYKDGGWQIVGLDVVPEGVKEGFTELHTFMHPAGQGWRSSLSKSGAAWALVVRPPAKAVGGEQPAASVNLVPKPAGTAASLDIPVYLRDPVAVQSLTHDGDALVVTMDRAVTGRVFVHLWSDGAGGSVQTQTHCELSDSASVRCPLPTLPAGASYHARAYFSYYGDVPDGVSDRLDLP